MHIKISTKYPRYSIDIAKFKNYYVNIMNIWGANPPQIAPCHKYNVKKKLDQRLLFNTKKALLVDLIINWNTTLKF